MIAREHIDADAQKVIRHLTKNGYQAYLVGGCVRDLLLGRKPKDFDVATSATPSEIRDLFRNCRIIGRRFRLAHIVYGRKVIETATFRKSPREADPEGGVAVAEGGEPAASESGELYIFRDNVFGTAEEDARRRDFTVNGLFYDLETEHVIDYVGGLEDLRQRSVRTIGDPNVRFREDPVRILRAVKFAARLGLDIEDATYLAMISHRSEILKSPPPRVLEEIFRLMKGGAALESILLLGEVGLLAVLLPEVEALLKRSPAALDPYLTLLDERVQAGDVPSNAVLLVLLLAPEFEGLFEEGADRMRGTTEVIDRVLEPLAMRLKVARRDAERAKLLLLSQRHILQGRKRGGKLRAGISSRDFFGEAVGLHSLFSRVLRARAGISGEAISAEIASWPYPQPDSLHAPEPGARREGRPGAHAAEARSNAAAVAAEPGSAEGTDGALGAEGTEGADGSLGTEGGSEPPRRRRRRRRRPEDDAQERDARPRHHALAVAAEDEEPIPNEEAVLSAFTAALNNHVDDE